MAVGLQLAGKNDFVRVQEDINDNLTKLDEAIDFNLLATLGIEYGGILNNTEVKVAGKAYYDTTGKKLYKCTANTSINYADAGYFEALSNNDLLGRLIIKEASFDGVVGSVYGEAFELNNLAIANLHFNYRGINSVTVGTLLAKLKLSKNLKNTLYINTNEVLLRVETNGYIYAHTDSNVNGKAFGCNFISRLS